MAKQRGTRLNGLYRAFYMVLACASVICGATWNASASDIDLGRYRLTFSEEFLDLSVSANGPGTKWIAHTPWGGDFGDAQFVDPREGFPFTVSNGVLRIEARRDADGKWQSGLLASVDSSGVGFSQQYGYFEARAKLPRGKGLWPAFWLNSVLPKGSDQPGVEVDVLEHYGHFPQHFESVINIWYPDKTKNYSHRQVHDVPAGSLYDEFRLYGVSVESEWIVVYLDRKEIWRVRTPPEHKNKLMILVNLAMGSGWPIDEAPNPSYMYVDYIRAYALR
ncbi:MAG TPA: glycoside hydrolase family 16 protein [Microvirga sp.]|jgi:beta-glucanase (GH16 family)|nr:glycoside hydrolase family 16 protein [Microvirga sp.]